MLKQYLTETSNFPSENYKYYPFNGTVIMINASNTCVWNTLRRGKSKLFINARVGKNKFFHKYNINKLYLCPPSQFHYENYNYYAFNGSIIMINASNTSVWNTLRRGKCKLLLKGTFTRSNLYEKYHMQKLYLSEPIKCPYGDYKYAPLK